MPRRIGAGRAFAAKAHQPPFEIDCVATKAAFCQEHGKFGRRACLSCLCGFRHHMRQPHRQGEPAHGGAGFGQPTGTVDGFKRRKQASRFSERRSRRRIEKRQARRIGHAESGAVEHEARQVGLQDFGRREGRHRRRLLGTPETNGDAGPGAAGAAGALVGRGARDAHRLQAGQPGRRLIFRQARQAAVDDDTHPVDGDGGLGDGRCQHHLAAAGGRRADRGVLRFRVELSIERDEVRIGGQPPLQALGSALDLALAGQEGEHGAGLVAQRRAHRLRHRVLYGLAGRTLAVADVDGIGAARALEHRRAGQERSDPRAVQRRRHDHEA